MKLACVVALLLIRISGSPSPATSSSEVSLSPTDCATTSQAAWDAHGMPFTPYEYSPGDTVVEDACADSSALPPVVELP